MMKKYVLLIAVLMAVLGSNAVKADGLPDLHARAEQGDPDAQFSLGFAYKFGIGVDSDWKKAVEWFRKAAEQGQVHAQFRLGSAYWTGEGVDEDLRQAVYWLRKSAEQGEVRAQASLGAAYWYGVSGGENPSKAVYWLRKAAESDDAFAQTLLGEAYWYGKGVEKDLRKAAEWYRKAAAQGNAYAQYSLGFAYDIGKGVEKDPRKAVQWYRKAAEQGNASAQYNLGYAYWKGEGVDEDLHKAINWFYKAAEQGNVLAQVALGTAYGLGEGVVADEKEAYIWFLIAKANGGEDTKDAIALYELYLSASEIQSAQKEATSRYEAIENRAYESEPQNNLPDITDIAKPPTDSTLAQQVFENTWRSVVVIETKDAQGSGVIIRPNIVATNCHVVDNAKRIAVYKSVARRADDDNAFAARIRHADKRRDFCLLDVDGLWGIAATVRKYATLKVGESVYGLGAPKGLDLSLSDGLISQLREIDGNRKIQTNVAISPGSSGGGLFDREGNLIGIMSSKITDESVEGIGFAIPADLVLRE